MKIVVLDGYALNPGDQDWGCLETFGQLTVYDRTPSEEDTIHRIADAEIVLTNKTPITEAVLSACPGIQMIGVLATGHNVVDSKAAKSRGIPVCNVPSYGTAAVAQFTIGLLLEVCHRIGFHDKMVHEGAWVRSPDFTFWRSPQTELAGKTMGIIGFGRIGRAVGRIAAALGMEVIAYSRSQCQEGLAIGNYVSLPELLERSDVISLHCPLTAENTHMLDDAAFAAMKPGAILINTARGPLIDDFALVRALESGKLRAAALDVISKEPMEADNPLLNAPNCIITPHIAWAPLESRKRLLSCVAENIRAFLEGKPQNVVNL